MITPIIIQIVFWIGVAFCLYSGGRIIVASFDVPDYSRFTSDMRDFERMVKPGSGRQFSPTMFAEGLLVFLVGPLLVRIACELDIILFKIHDELKTANDRTRYRT